MNDEFLHNLNENQKAAVMHDSGPLLIVAGAGTGKTRVITSRILRLISEGKAKSDEILALTFTEKAASEMVERVDVAMPLGYEEVNIKTFHGFCERVLRESGLDVGIDPSYKMLDKLSQWIFVKKHLFDFELNHFRPLGNPGSFINTLLTHFSRIKEEYISPLEYVEYAEKKLEEVKGKSAMSAQEEIDPKSVLGIEIIEAEKVLEAAKAYETYQELMLKEGCMDFGDLSYFVLKLFDEHPDVLKEYRERFKYIMVDEFQDTNYAQFKLILLLSDKNICVVGDDDQSIFRWRGASLSNILQFKKAFPGTKQIVLTENYRSNQNILDSSHQFIKNNDPDRLEFRDNISKKLRSQSDEVIPIMLNSFKNYSSEVGFVSAKIEEMVGTGTALSDIAILVRSNASSVPYANALKEKGIPYYVRNPKGLLSYDEVKDVVSVIKVLANPLDDVAMLRVLSFPSLEVPMAQIVELYQKAKSAHSHVYEELNKIEDASTLPGIEPPATKFLNLLAEAQEHSKNLSAGSAIEYFLRKSGYLGALSSEISKESMDKSSNIAAFSRIVWDFEQNNTDNSILDFASHLGFIEESNVPLSEDSSSDADFDAVQIFTTHGAKGLEFDTVFVVNLVNHKFPVLNKRETLKIPIELTKEIFPEGDFHIEEERRLFYVALTRAKRNLFLSYSDKYEGNKKWKRSQFLDEVCESGLVVEKEESESGAGADLLSAKYSAPKIIHTAPKNFLGRSLSYSQIDTFKTCPLKYAYRYMLNVPTKPSHAANFGTSIHETLNDFYRALTNGGEVNFALMTKLYGENWISAGYDSGDHETARKAQGLNMLEEFYNSNSDPWIVPKHLEKNFNIKVGEHMFTGRIDRIDEMPDGSFEVIDYKTGKSKALNVQHKLQMSIYALACRDIFHIPASKLSLYFLDDNKKVSMKKVPSDLDSVKNDILFYIEELKKSDFRPTPGFLCSFCDYKLICPAV